MAYTFAEKPVATIKAKITGTSDTINIAGTNPAETSCDNAAAQINKLMNLVGDKTVQARGMTRTLGEEAVES